MKKENEMKKWYLRGKGKNFGPYSTEQLNTLLDKNKIKVTTLISTDEKNWKPLESHNINNIENKKSIVNKPQITSGAASLSKLKKFSDNNINRQQTNNKPTRKTRRQK